MINRAVTKSRRWTTDGLKFVTVPASPSGGGMCDSSLVLPGNVVYDHSVSQPLLPSLSHACPGGARRWTALWAVGFAKLFHDLAEWFLAT